MRQTVLGPFNEVDLVLRPFYEVDFVLLLQYEVDFVLSQANNWVHSI